MEKILEFKNTVRFYPPNLRAVNDVSFSINSRETICVCGVSGSGKTTLMRLICGMEKADTGEIYLFGKPLHQMTEEQIAMLRAKRIGVLTADAGLVKELTVYENAVLPFTLRNVPKSEYTKQAKSLLETLGLYNLRHSVAGQITPYQKCLTGIARAILTKPDLLLVDDFDYHLSYEESEKAWDFLRVIVTHSNITTIFFMNEAVKKINCNRKFKMTKGTLKEVSK